MDISIMSTIADKLQDLVTAKTDMKVALQEKGVTPTGGLSTYADAIGSIQQQINIEASNIDYTQIGWTIDDAVKQNEIDKSITDKDVEYSKMVMEQFKDGFSDTLWDKLYPNIVYMPIVDLSSQTNLNALFGGYKYQSTSRPVLRVFPSIDTRNAQDMEYIFSFCSNLESVGLLNCERVRSVKGMFMYCYKLKHLGGFKNLGYSISTISSLADGNLDLRESPFLTTESVLNIFNTIASVSTSKKCQITLHTNVFQTLNDEDIAIATNKGWTISSV